MKEKYKIIFIVKYLMQNNENEECRDKKDKKEESYLLSGQRLLHSRKLKDSLG